MGKKLSRNIRLCLEQNPGVVLFETRLSSCLNEGCIQVVTLVNFEWESRTAN